MHRGPKGGANLEDDFDALRFGLPRKPALAHRLDRDTAGCLVLGRHHKALEKLGLLFKQGKIAKTYWAIVVGGPETEEGLIDLPLGRLDATRGWWMKVDPAGLPAQTRWRVEGARPLARGADRLAGTRAADRPHPSIARPLRGRGLADPGRSRSTARARDIALQLLARRVEAPLYKNKPAIVVEAPAPDHMRETLAACGFAGDPPREPSARRGLKLRLTPPCARDAADGAADRLRQRLGLLGRSPGREDEAHAGQRQARQALVRAEHAQVVADHADRQRRRGEPGAHDRDDGGVVLGEEQAVRRARPIAQRGFGDLAPQAARAAQRQRNRRALGRLEALGGDPDQRLLADQFEALQALVIRHQRDFDRAGVNLRAEFGRILANDRDLDQRVAAIERA